MNNQSTSTDFAAAQTATQVIVNNIPVNPRIFSTILMCISALFIVWTIGACAPYRYTHKNPAMSRHEGDMIKAVINRDRQALAAFVDMGCSVNFQRDDDSTLLIRAVYRNDSDMVDDLLKYGADPNLADGTGLSPLMIAANGGSYSIVDRLLRGGAKVDQKDNNGTAVLGYAAKAGASQAEIARILIKYGADVNALDGGIFKSPPLFRAVAESAYDVAETLLQHGAKIEAKDGDGNTIDHYLNDAGRAWLKNQQQQGVNSNTP